MGQFAQICQGLYDCYMGCDASLAEINPLAVLGDGSLKALDGKMVLDDNALFRHADLAAMRDEDEETPEEREARLNGLSYVKLDGEIGCMVNGAGLAMATMDIIKFFGGAPANFLDVGGGAKADKVAAALRIILSDPNVKAVLFNIFGGITRCDEVARGILQALEEVPTQVPMVVRLVGTNDEEGRAILAEAKMATAETLAEAAQKAVAAAQRVRLREPRSDREGEDLMSILVNKDTRLLVQGITGREGAFHTEQMIAYGTKVVAGVTPGKGGGWAVGNVPIFDTRARGGRRDRRQRQHHLRAGQVRAGRHPGGRRRRRPADRLHHRGHPGAGHAEGARLSGSHQVPPDRPELPGPDHAR